MADVAKRKWQIGLESTSGTEVDATRKLYFKGSLEKNIANKVVELDSSYDKRRTKKRGIIEAGGKLEGILDVLQIVEILKMAIDGDAAGVQQGGSAAYLWTFTPDDVLKSATIEWYDANKYWTMVYAMIDELNIKGSVNGDIAVDLSLLGKDLEEKAMTASLSDFTPNALCGWETKLYIDPLGTAPGTTNVAATLIDFEFKLKNNLKRRYLADNIQTLASIARGERTVDLSLTYEVSNFANTEWTNFLNGTDRVIEIEIGQNKVIDSSYKEFVKLQIPGTIESMKIDEDEETTVWKLDVANMYDPANAFAFQVQVQNNRSA